MNIKNFELSDPFDAPRNIELLPQDERDVEAIRKALSQSGLTTQKLFDLFKDQQSDKSKSIKRFVLSLSFILSLTLVAGVDITDINLFGLEVKPDNSIIFLSSILFIHIVLFIYFIYLRWNDMEIKNAMVSNVKKATESYIDLAKKLDEIRHKYDLPSVDYLLSDFRDNATVLNPNEEDIEAYRALKFYQKNLQTSHRGFEFIERMEILSIYGLAILAALAIIFSF